MQEEASVEKEISAHGVGHENFQRLPEHVTDMHVGEEIVSKLETVRTLGLVGRGGLRKTTRAVFNILVPKFDYSCFLSDVKLIEGTEDDMKEKLWECLHFQGRKVGGERNLSALTGKRLLLALDDVSDRDIKVLLDLAEDADPSSRFIWTCRERDISNDVGATHQVNFLAENHFKLLVMKHAFPEARISDTDLESLVGDIVSVCDGLPVLGKHDWEKIKQEVWKATLVALERAEKNDMERLWAGLWATLTVSFESFKQIGQELSLEVTNILCEMLREGEIVLREFGKVSEQLWQILADMSLVFDRRDEEEW